MSGGRAWCRGCVHRWLGQGQPVGEVTAVTTQSSDDGRLRSRPGPEAGVNVAGVKSSDEVSEPGAGPARTVAETGQPRVRPRATARALQPPVPFPLVTPLTLSVRQRPVCQTGLTTEPAPRGCCDMLPHVEHSQKRLARS